MASSQHELDSGEGTAVPVWVWRRMLRDHGPDDRSVLLTLYALSTWMDGDGFAFPGQEKIAAGARISVRTLRRHIQVAESLGWIHVESVGNGQGWRRYQYRATVPNHLELSELNQEITDYSVAANGDVERADTAMSPPSSDTQKRADISDETCGHLDSNVRTFSADVRTQLCPLNSSVFNSSNSSDTEGAPSRTPPKTKETKNEEKELGKVAKRVTRTSPEDIEAERSRQLAELNAAEAKRAAVA